MLASVLLATSPCPQTVDHTLENYSRFANRPLTKRTTHQVFKINTLVKIFCHFNAVSGAGLAVDAVGWRLCPASQNTV
jgi:hypothetical protein